MQPVDVAAFLAEDEIEEGEGLPFRFGAPFDVNYSLSNSGQWEDLPESGRVWRLRIVSEGAYSINLIYDDFKLPAGAELFVYSGDLKMVIGAFTEENNKQSGLFATAPVKGDDIVVEYFEPLEVKGRGSFTITRVVHSYKDIFGFSGSKDKGYGGSGSCNNNVNCPVGVDWQNEKRSIAMVLLGGGTRWCSGAMVNNVREDGTPYFLTANHCLTGEENWIIMFRYESPTCTNQNGPTNYTVHGTTLRASNSYSDFALVELDEVPPPEYEVYLSGWNNVNVAAPSVVGIHHPSGDIKKISFENNPVTSANYLSTSGNTHWRVADWDDGTTEGGSSGSPIYSPDHKIVGQLHGGYASCASQTADWYGKFSNSWDYGSSVSTRLRDWLDPDNTGATILDGRDLYTGTQPVAEFSATPTFGCASLTVNFADESTGDITDWSWDFGDGGYSASSNPIYTYTNGGVYTVSLTVTGPEGGDTEIKTAYVTVSETPVAGFTGFPMTGTAPLTVNFADQSSNSPTGWYWDFGDTGTSQDRNVPHVYTDPGVYTVTLTAVNSCGPDEAVKTDYITVDLPVCCEDPSVGDLDQSKQGLPNNVDGIDLAIMIDGLFISLDWSEVCLDEADIDFSCDRPCEDTSEIEGMDLSAMIDALFISMVPLTKCDGSVN